MSIMESKIQEILSFKLNKIQNLIDFRTYCKNSIEILNNAALQMYPIYDNALKNNDDDEITSEIKIGSKVLYVNGDHSVEGRVLDMENGLCWVHRVGFVGTVKLAKERLQNLSLSKAAEIERQIFLLDHRIDKLFLHLQDSEIPDVLLKNKFNFIEVIGIPNVYNGTTYYHITFISSIDKKSYHLKIQPWLINELGYYQIEMRNDDLHSVMKSTKNMFEENSGNFELNNPAIQ